jgi:hypothetical protein
MTSHLCVVPRLRMTGAIPSIPLYAFVTFTASTLPFHLFQILAVRAGGKKWNFETAFLICCIAFPYSNYVSFSRSFSDLRRNILVQNFC